MNLKLLINIIIISLICVKCTGQETKPNATNTVKIVVSEPSKELPIIVGAERIDSYIKLLK